MHKTQKRRRVEYKTDYQARFSFLKSEKPRLVVRKSNRYIIAQIVQSNLAQDKVIASVNSKQLLEQGWPKEKEGSLKSLHAAYLTGFFLAKNVKGKVKEVFLDSGLYRNIRGSRIYAAVKGAIDGGLVVPHDKGVLPSEERLKTNKNLYNLVEKIKEKL